ncbi:MAG: hypothetical protein BroJett011_04840 [Chloroflexota bacterium]|nr:MAG: hypothetical protein BroJett011_04840 [Chloroflexota bacterium]
MLQYREALQNPPLLVVSDIDSVVIHTNFTNTIKRVGPLIVSFSDYLQLTRSKIKATMRLTTSEAKTDAKLI